MKQTFKEFLRTEFPPPRYMALKTAGVDISTSGIKCAFVILGKNGYELSAYGNQPLPQDAIVDGSIEDAQKVVNELHTLASRFSIEHAYVSLPESRGYLFEAHLPEGTKEEQKIYLESHLEEYVPLPPKEVVFDYAPIAQESGTEHIAGVGYSRALVHQAMELFETANIDIRAIESENFALPRALLRPDNTETVLIIDVGRTTTKLLFVTSRIPRYATTLTLGGHAFTIAIEKYFNVSEEDAKEIKVSKGIVQSKGNEEYVNAMLATVSVMKDEIGKRIEYWNSLAGTLEKRQQVQRAIIVGGNASIKGLPEYFEAAFGIPFELGDVFVNFASKDHWLPPMEFMESLAYASTIGLALRENI
jgi:type IV pilus assembly protein PilM